MRKVFALMRLASRWGQLRTRHLRSKGQGELRVAPTRIGGTHDPGPDYSGPRSCAGQGRRGGAVIAGHSRDTTADDARTPGDAVGSNDAGAPVSTTARLVSDTERAAASTADPAGIGALRSILRIRPFRRLWLVLRVASVRHLLGPLR